MPVSARGGNAATVGITVPGHKYVASTHTPSSGNGGHHGGSSDEWQERCHALQIENRELKIARNQQEQTLKDLTAQFARLKRDLKIPGSPNGDAASSSADASMAPEKLKARLLAVTKQRDDALRLVDDLKAKLTRYRAYERGGSAPPAVGGGFTPRAGSGATTTGGASHRHHSHIAAAAAVGAEVNVLDLLDGNQPHHQGHHGKQLLPRGQPSMAETIPLAAHEAAVRDLEQRARRDDQRIRDLMAERDAIRRQADVARQTRSAASSTLDRGQIDAERIASVEAEATQLRQRFATVAAQLESVTLERDRFAADLNSARAAYASSPNGANASRPAAQQAAGGRRFDSTSGGDTAAGFNQNDNNFAASQPLPRLGAFAPVTTSMEHSQRIIADHAEDLHPDVRSAVAEQTAQLAILARRFGDAQSHAVTLQRECERLVGELGAIQNTLTTEKRRIFALESEKATLTIKVARTEEVEFMLNLKNEELITCQQQLLEMADKMSTYVREAESTAKLEHASRLHDANTRAEAAERDQRAKERELYAVKLELQDAARHRDAAREDLADVKSRLETATRERSDLQQRLVNTAASLPAQPGAVEESIARMMASRGAGSGGQSGIYGAAADDESSAAESSSWELSTLREAVAATARDLEFAEQRADALERDIQTRTDALVLCTKQRDDLLGENLRLRQEVTGIRTSLESRERAVIDESAGAAASIAMTIERIECVPSALLLHRRHSGGGAASAAEEVEEDAAAVGAAPTLFVSVDGVSAFEPAVSDMVYATDADVDLRFDFRGLAIGGDAAEGLRRDSAQFQLHRSTGLTSHVVAAASMRIARNLAKLLEGGGEAMLRVPMLDGAGEAVAEIVVRVKVSHVALALAVVRPDMAIGNGDDDDEATRRETATYALATLGKGDAANKINAWLFSFRGVTAIRVTVLRCDGLACNPATGVAPTPYVFYTVDTAGDASLTSIVQDTVVHTSGRQLTCDPIFDADPAEHAVRVGSKLYDFVCAASITFAVFDARSDDAESNLGTTTLPLAALAASPQSTIVQDAALHPSGRVSVAISWVR